MRILRTNRGEKIKVSDRDYRFLSQFNWTLDRHGYPYARVVISKLILSADPALVRDHKNNDKQDNRRCNLQLITVAQNVQRARPSKSSKKTSKYRGVCWHRDAKKWRAVLSFREDGKKTQQHLGVFSKEKSAARAYDRAARKRWGRFAWQNL